MSGAGPGQEREAGGQQRPRLDSRWLLAGVTFVLALAGFVALVVWVPPMLLNTHGSPDPVKAVNDFRATLVTAVGGVALGAGTVIAALTLQQNRRALAESQRQNREAQRQNTAVLDVTRHGQLTERFSRAVDQLGDEERISIRLGGIYALERIALESAELHPAVMELLTAFLREHSPGTVADVLSADGQDTLPFPRVRADLQAIIDVVGRRDLTHELSDPRWHILNLSGAHLSGATFMGVAQWQRTVFAGAQLQRAKFTAANVEEALFDGANLDGAFFSLAKLQRADFSRANLHGTQFVQASLQEATFFEANLQKASFFGAKLQDACFYLARLQGANFSQADLAGALFRMDLPGVRNSPSRDAQGLTWEQLAGADNVETASLPEYVIQRERPAAAQVHNKEHHLGAQDVTHRSAAD